MSYNVFMFKFHIKKINIKSITLHKYAGQPWRVILPRRNLCQLLKLHFFPYNLGNWQLFLAFQVCTLYIFGFFPSFLSHLPDPRKLFFTNTFPLLFNHKGWFLPIYWKLPQMQNWWTFCLLLLFSLWGIWIFCTPQFVPYLL